MPRGFDISVDLTKHQILNAVLQILNGEHGSPVEALIWWNSTTNRIQIYDGAAVKSVAWTGEGGGSDAATLDGQDGVYYLDRANHTGTQLADTISDFNTAVNNLLSGYATDADVAAAISSLIDAAPGTLDTLNELAAALGDDPNFATTITNEISAKTGKFTATVGDGAATSIVVTHNLGTRAVAVSVDDATTFAEKTVGVEKTTINTVTLTFDTAPALNSRLVTIIG